MSRIKEINTNSVRSAADYKDLESFFRATDEDVSSFMDVLREHMEERPTEQSLDVTRKLLSGKPDRVSAPNLLQQSLSGFVRIFHGWHNKDYVWHIEHAAIRRPWKVSTDKVIYMIAKVMHDLLPDIEATIWPPQRDWELRTITFKALRLKDEWSFSEDIIDSINNRLFEVLNKVV